MEIFFRVSDQRVSDAGGITKLVRVMKRTLSSDFGNRITLKRATSLKNCENALTIFESTKGQNQLGMRGRLNGERLTYDPFMTVG